MTTAEVELLGACLDSLKALREALRGVRLARDNHGDVRAKLIDAIAVTREAAQHASDIVFEQRCRYVQTPDSETAHQALCYYPATTGMGIWAAEVLWLDGYIEPNRIVPLRESSIKWHGRLRRRFLAQNPISSSEAFSEFIGRFLRVQVEPIVSLGRRSRSKRRISRASEWLDAAIILVRNSQSEVDDVYGLSYSLASARLGRKL